MMYKKARINCYLPVELQTKLSEHSKSTLIPQSSIIVLALQDYFKKIDTEREFVNSLKNDPKKLADFARAFGLDSLIDVEKTAP